MDKIAEAGLAALAVLGFIGWLGGGRKWAFRTMLATLILVAAGVAGILLYTYGDDKVAEHRAHKLHECAVAKVADPKCEKAPKNDAFPEGSLICPLYFLPDNASPEKEEEAIAAAEQECRGEMDPEQKSIHEQINEYKRKHGINDPYAAIAEPMRPDKDKATSAVDYDALAKKYGGIKVTLGPVECAARVRKAYPGAYNDLDDATLTKKVLAKYPNYCDTSTPDFIPDIQGIR